VVVPAQPSQLSVSTHTSCAVINDIGGLEQQMRLMQESGQKIAEIEIKHVGYTVPAKGANILGRRVQIGR
jgi:hypothetical protein